MSSANLINGGIQFLIGIMFLLVAMPVIPIGKTEEDRKAKHEKFGKLFG